MKIESDYSLLSHNTFGVDARCRWFVEYNSIDELQTLLRDEYFRELPSLHIGGGSNLLFVNDFEGAILHSAIKQISVTDETADFIELFVGAAVVWDNLARHCVENGWYGAENLSLIPGETGAAAVQNIGAYGVEVKDLIQSVQTIDIASGEEVWFERDDCRYGYRRSIFKEELKGRKIITGVCFRLSKKERYSLEYGNIKDQLHDTANLSLPQVRETIIAIRNDKLPDWKRYGNAGSFFMNPSVKSVFFNKLKLSYPNVPGYPLENGNVKIPAAWLIEQCGWKGKREGDAGVWPKQPLVLVNYGGATGADIASLAEAIKLSVAEKFDIDISPEVMYI